MVNTLQAHALMRTQSHKDLPTQFLRSDGILSASVVLASFGDSDGYFSEAFPLSVKLDSAAPTAATEKPLRYGKLPEIHHIFRSDPNSPNFVLVAFFTIAAVATLPVLLGLVSHSTKMLSSIVPLLTVIPSGSKLEAI